MKRFLCLFLCLCLLAGSVSPVLAAEAGGQFALAALTADGILIDPVYIRYEAGQSISDALLASPYSFTGLAETGWIQEVEGVADSYSLFYDDNGWDLTAPASVITALCITTRVDHYSAEYLELIRTMADFSAAENGVQTYEAARAAYDAAAKELYTAGAARAAELSAALREAMEDYEVFISGETVLLTLDAGMTVDVTLTGRFGNSYTAAQVTSMEVIPGEYDFDISDGGINHIRGTVTVEGNTVLTVELPAGQWLASMDLSIANGEDWAAVEKLDDWTFAVPDYSGRHLYPYFVPAGDVDTAACAIYLGDGAKRTWRSHETSLTRVLEPDSMAGTVLELEARQAWGDYVQVQTYPVEIVRVPSLSALEVWSGGTRLPLDFDPAVGEYTLSTTGASVDVTAVARCDGTAVTVNGAEADGSVHIPLTEDTTEITVETVHENGQGSTYTLTVNRLEGVAVTIVTGAESVAVYNGAGAAIGGTEGVFCLVPGEPYTYVTTTDEYFHTSAGFTASAGLTIHAPAPETADALVSLSAAAAAKAEPYDRDAEFSPEVHEYTFRVGSNETGFGILASLSDTFGDHTMTAHYPDYRTWDESYAGEKTTNVTGSFRLAPGFLGVSGIGSSLTLRIHREEAGVTYYQDYIMHVQRRMQLNGLTASANGQSLVLNQPDGTTGFSKFVTEYALEAGQTVPELRLDMKLFSTDAGGDDAVLVTVEKGDWAYTLDYSLLSVSQVQTVMVPLDTDAPGETVSVTVAREGAEPQTYVLDLVKQPPVEVSITVDPAEAALFLTDDVTQRRVIPEENGNYILNTGRSYTYVAAHYGYLTGTASFVAGGETRMRVTLTPAPENTLADIALDTDWLSFRGNDDNNGIVSAPTPIQAEEAVLNWANKIGAGNSNGGVGSPIIVGGELYTYAGTTVCRIDKDTGEILASAEMDHASSFCITPPAYGDGMIFVALADGGVQAFHARTLESLWVYRDALLGQPNCPVTYQDGYLYTGFWNSEKKQANFVCISVTDEDPAQAKERKLASWTYTHNGFYWAGAYVSDGFLLVTTDDGANGYTTGHGSILSIDPGTGLLLDELVMPGVGDLRSAVCYDSATDAYYFTSKGGDFYRVQVEEDGTFRTGSLRQLSLTNGTEDPATPPMSTSTPVVYNGRAYIGVSGTAQFTAWSGHNITVIDLNNWKIAYTVPTQGYPQTSGLLTTAYEGETEYVYVYFLDNFTPGKLRVIRDTAGQNVFDTAYSTVENGMASGYVLFTPSGSQAQYAICSPIADEYGNLYFKNDSGYLMCLGSTVTGLTVTQAPQRLEYEVGEVFDPTGMQITAVYANGVSRDVTKYVRFSEEPLTVEDTELTLLLDLGEHQMMYQDRDGEAGVEYHLPTATVDLTILTEHRHRYGAVVTDPTCTEPGFTTHTCRCGDSYTDTPTEPLGHDWQGGTCARCGTAAEDPFTDVQPGAFYYEPVLWAVREGVTNGTSATTFGPNDQCMRAHVVTFLWRAAGSPEPVSTENPFVDVQESAFYYKAVLWAVENGVTQGLDATHFGPFAYCNRAQVVTFLHRAMGSPEPETPEHPFTDVQSGAFYEKAVLWAVQEGITSGLSATAFGPGSVCNRAQIVTFLYRTFH